MADISIVSDSACDMGLEMAKENDIILVPFEFTFDGKKYYRENIDMPIQEFYRTLRTETVYPKTSLPSTHTYADVFKGELDKGNDVICFCITSKFSGSYQSACNARDILKSDYPNRVIVVLDTYQSTLGQCMLVLEAARMRRDGLPFDAIVEKSEKMKKMGTIYVTVDSLTYLQRGGRIGKASAFAGNLLSIKPVIVFTNGELNPHSKVRGRKKALNEVAALIKKDIGSDKHKYYVTFMHGDELQEATALRDAQFDPKEYDVSHPITFLGVTIGSHIGPTTIALGYMIKYEYL